MADGSGDRRSTGVRLWLAGPLLALIASLGTAPRPAEAARHATIIADAETGAVLLESNSRAKAYPASLTKMMTLYLLFEAVEAKRISLNSPLRVSSTASRQPPTKIGVKAGGSISVQKAILALVVQSANDVAVVVAEALGGSERKFARLMTKRAHALGMKDTVFRNASGLPDDSQVTTARDMAILARALISRFPDYYHYFSAPSFSYNGRTYRSHNRVLKAYAGADGLKTGYTRASGYNLATSAERDGRRLIAIVLGGKTAKARDAQMVQLLDRGFTALAGRPQQLASLPPVVTDAKGSGTKVRVATSHLVPPKKPVLAAGNAFSVPVASLMPASEIETDTLVAPGGLPPSKPTLAMATVSVAAVAALLAPSAAAAEMPPSQPGWGIQVGAFSSYEPAERAALHATKQAPKLLESARVSVDETVKASTGMLYRARLVGLSKDRAEAACRQLAAKSQPCLVFQSGVTLAMGEGRAPVAAQ